MTNKSSAIDILCMGIFSLVRFRHPYLGEYSRFVNLSFHISRILGIAGLVLMNWYMQFRLRVERSLTPTPKDTRRTPASAGGR
jgi:hypothetical protein